MFCTISTQLAQIGLLSRFVGMLTDSRSFLSYTRHEYFRRRRSDSANQSAPAGSSAAACHQADR
jgi:glucuronate isomerase